MVSVSSLTSLAEGKYFTIAKSTATKLIEAPASSKLNQASQGMVASKLNQDSQGMVDLNAVKPLHIKYFHSDVDNLFAMPLNCF